MLSYYVINYKRFQKSHTVNREGSFKCMQNVRTHATYTSKFALLFHVNKEKMFTYKNSLGLSSKQDNLHYLGQANIIYCILANVRHHIP